MKVHAAHWNILKNISCWPVYSLYTWCILNCPVISTQKSKWQYRDLHDASRTIMWFTIEVIISLLFTTILSTNGTNGAFLLHIAGEYFCCCQYLLQCQMTRLNCSKESQYIFGDCNKFHFMPNLPVSYSCLLTILVGILCDVSPICQSLRSAHSRDSTGNGGSRSKVLRNLHNLRNQVPHLLRYVKEIVWLHCKSNLSIKGRSQ